MICGITFWRDAVSRCLGASTVVAALALGCVTTVSANAAPPANAQTEAGVTAFAMRWFGDMQAGRTDRSQYAAIYGAQLTDEAVKGMSETLNRYGTSPLRAEIVQTQKVDEQTFYLVRYVFPRGDATSLLFGFDTEGKITGVAVESMAGD
jgi:hypothetical protein